MPGEAPARRGCRAGLISHRAGVASLLSSHRGHRCSLGRQSLGRARTHRETPKISTKAMANLSGVQPWVLEKQIQTFSLHLYFQSQWSVLVTPSFIRYNLLSSD